jgi:sialate O-acetylesterase
MNHPRFRLGILVFLVMAAGVRAAIVLAAPFRDGAVIQRGKPIPVWGKAQPGETVEVEFGGQMRKTVADEQGRWSVRLGPFAANSAPAKLTATGRDVVTVRNVLVGEVWLCSGQSNMNFPLKQAANAPSEIAGADYPLIRHFVVDSAVSDRPLEMVGGEWQASSPDTAGSFTAVGYFFGRELFRKLGVPIGIMKATLGGSPIEAWLSEDALGAEPAFGVVAARWRVMRPRIEGRGFRNQPGGLYNGLIHPLEPGALAGFLWYQGEGNAERAMEYEKLFLTMIRQWRRDFQQGDLPFIFAQLPNFAPTNDLTGQSWAWLRAAQAAALSLPHVGMAVTIDIGDNAALHPANKQDVGRRLALVALAKVYGLPVGDTGPTFAGMEPVGAELRIRFKQADGLRFVGDPGRVFELAGDDRKFVPAVGRIDGETVIVSAPDVTQPVAVRFSWRNAPAAHLVNRGGLPAAPFRTDQWSPAPTPGKR